MKEGAEPGSAAERLIDEGTLRYNAGRYAQALRCFERAAASSRPGSGLRFYMGHCLRSLGRGAEAGAQFAAVLAEDPGCLPAYCGLARLAFDSGDLPRSGELLKKALRRDPGNAEALRLRGDLERAAEAARAGRAKKTAPETAAERRRAELRARIDERLRGRRWAEAEPLLKGLLKFEPGGVDARRGLCWVYLKRSENLMDAGRWDRVGALQKAIVKTTAREPLDTPMKSMRFQALMRLGRFDAAFGEAEKALAAGITLAEARTFAQPWDAEHHARYASKSLPALKRMARKGRRAPWAEFCLGDLLPDCAPTKSLSTERYGWMNYAVGRRLIGSRSEKAFTALRLSLRFEPRDWRAHAFLAEGWLCRGRPKSAMAEFRRALKIAPEGELSQVLAWRGELKLWLGEYRASLLDLDEACRLGGLGAEFAYGWRGAAKFKLGRREDALLDLNRVLECRPRDHEASVWRGELYREMGKYDEALNDLSREPVGTWARVNRALTRAALKDFAGLRDDFQALPDYFVDFLRRRACVRSGELSAPQMTRLLSTALAAAKGFRREEYRQAIWMTGAAARPAKQLNSSKD